MLRPLSLVLALSLLLTAIAGLPAPGPDSIMAYLEGLSRYYVCMWALNINIYATKLIKTREMLQQRGALGHVWPHDRADRTMVPAFRLLVRLPFHSVFKRKCKVDML